MKLYLLFILLFISISVVAQDSQKIGVAGDYLKSDGKDGNGNSFGITVYSLNNIIKKPVIQVRTEVAVSVDYKNYLSRYGKSIRAMVIPRVYLFKGVYVQGGYYYGYFKIGGSGGYSKSTHRPIYGGGYFKSFSVVALDFSYLRYPKNKLYSLGVVDGVTSEHSYRGEISIPLDDKFKWSASTFIELSNATYQRDPIAYGSVLGSVLHKSNAVKVSLGIFRKY